eukprot:TRINITY_DN280_c0_g1_i1.p1 TRINITY_DN280_c0_g1~~TRINITY_DN280_c0_g1_i1.p1  ORF type:complete len:178 (+),score=106.77 TRINITY_DN280_c0_g1_i1:55-588(+)
MADAKLAAEIAGKLGNGAYVGGETPSAADVKLFNQLLGEGNSHLHRWVKSMASYTADERAAWKAVKPAKDAVKVSVSGDAPAAAAAAAPEKKVAKSAAVVEVALKAGADGAKLQKLIKQIKVEGLDFGKFTGGKDTLKWEPVVEDGKVEKQDLLDMTQGFKNYVVAEKTKVASWKSL